MGMDQTVADPQYGTNLGLGCFNKRYHKLLSQEDLGLQVNPPAELDLVMPAFPRKKKAMPARKPKGSPKMVTKGGVDVAVDSHDEGDRSAGKSPAPVTTPRKKKVIRRPKGSPKVGTKGGIDVIISSNDESDGATATGSPEL